MPYSQQLAIFIKFAGLDFEFLEEALRGEKLPRHLVTLYESEGLTIRNQILEDKRLEDVRAFAENLGIHIPH